jgi:hypothetical protein
MITTRKILLNFKKRAKHTSDLIDYYNKLLKTESRRHPDNGGLYYYVGYKATLDIKETKYKSYILFQNFINKNYSKK